MLRVRQIEAISGGVTYYIATDTYPSESYYEQKTQASENEPGVMYIPQPPTRDEEGTIFCNLKGRNDTESDIIVGIRPGGDVTTNESQQQYAYMFVFFVSR